ncbi:MAG: glycoside hydrolase family 97 catalytic domain-containing protein [Paenibacillaceae bacterium]|nr:glycoside hydrolase family 97 catalytic domain-containing protein [Paenibacillaceae bacterium]
MKPISIDSPNGRLKLTFGLYGAIGAGESGSRGLYYRLELDGNPLLLDSRLELAFQDEPLLGPELELLEHRIETCDRSWQPLYGERSTIRDRCTELRVSLRERREAGTRRLALDFRVYDEGAALRYHIPAREEGGALTLLREYTQFRFPAGCFGYEEHGTEGEYAKKPIGEIADHCEWPLTVQYPTGSYGCITEARMFDYSRMLLSRRAKSADTLVTDLTGPVRLSPPYDTPWRVMIVGDTPGQLLEHNDLVLNLNPPCEFDDVSWIRPGKAIREVTLSTRGGKTCVDFAVERGLDYIAYDAGWYGREHDYTSDATRVSLDPDRIALMPGHDGLLDIPEVVRYAESKGIGVFLYVNHKALERQLDQLLPLYRSWGVKGIKFGFVETGPQLWTVWLHEAVRKCAQYQLLVDIHDFYRPTGITRTYPHLLTQEGIRGNEHMPTARHNATLPFTRFPAGAGDATICYYDRRIRTTHAHQLAMSIIVYSPLQFLFWYDKPSAYEGEPEIELFRHLPVVWDDTKVLDGEIGEFATIARRSGETWFVGAITNEDRRDKSVALAFLQPGRMYEAFICTDDLSETASRTGVKVDRSVVTCADTLPLVLAASGGCAIWLRAK